MTEFKPWKWTLLCVLLVIVCRVGFATAQCSSHQYSCGNGKCLPLSWRCDDDDDCGDHTDEADCDCKPCSEAELLRYFCSADFLAQGTISALYRNEALARAELTVRADRVVRQTSAVFHARQPEAEADFRYGTVHLPLACGARHGGGRFLFVGRMMLDEPVLQCAPRLEEWEAIKIAARRDGTSQCELD